MEAKTVAQSIAVRRLLVDMHTEPCGCVQAVVNLQLVDLPPVQVRQRIWRNPYCKVEGSHLVGRVSVTGPHHVGQAQPMEKVRVEATRIDGYDHDIIQLELLDPETRRPTRLWWVGDKSADQQMRGDLHRRLENIENVGVAKVDHSQLKLSVGRVMANQQLVQVLRDAVNALQFAWNVEVTETVATFAISADLQSL